MISGESSASAFPAANAAQDFLLSRIDYERTLAIPYNRQEFHLDRMRRFLALLGNPQQRLNIVHVAGTKGKGSTAALIAAALSASGYITGLYTSPHLEHIEERIRIDGAPVSSSDFAALVELVRPTVERLDREGAAQSPPEPGPTYFEIITAMALLHFAARGVDAAVLEVGLGGRLDSTNVCQPLVSVITSISYDHTKQLGNTLAAIAREKAGIIKPRVPIVCGVLDDEPREVIASIAEQLHSPLIQLGRDFHFNYRASAKTCSEFDFHFRRAGNTFDLHKVSLSLRGRHQASNAAVALAALHELRTQGWRLPDAALLSAFANLHWPARVEVVSQRPLVVVDAAHNVASVQSLVETLDESFAPARRILIFATTQDKDVPGMLRLLLPKFEVVILTRYLNNPRAVEARELKSLVRQLSDQELHVCTDPAAAWQCARQLANDNDLICATGSFFLAAEIRAAIGSVDGQPGCAAQPGCQFGK